jgi:NAD(P)-dependent dehydrogenase (short-subunit alcohol dehydrogenase family)
MSKYYFSLENKIFLVTGASSGIGYEVCKGIHEQGGNFIAISRREHLLVNLLTETSQKNKYIVADLTKEDELNNIINKIGKIDGIVHCAGIVRLVPIKYYNKNLIDEMRSINYDSIINLVNLLSKNKKINRQSSIVLVSSLAGLFGMKGNGIYAGTKGALIAISRVWANEFAPLKIRVNCVSPGMVRTSMAENEDLPQKAYDEDEKKYPLGYGEPSDVSNVIIFLLSNGSKWITGQNLILDGGRTSSI